MELMFKLKTLKKVYVFLKENGLIGLITGEIQEGFNEIELLERLLNSDMINKFLNIIVKDAEKYDFDELEYDEVVDMLKSFFSKLTEKFKKEQIG